MSDVRMLNVITSREYYENYLEFFRSHELGCVMSSFCSGSATDKILACFGVDRSQKVLMQTFLTMDRVDEIKRALRTDMNINGLGNGIALFIALEGIGGKSAKNYLLGKEEEGVKQMEKENRTDFVLIITITNKGYNEVVMDSAREAGARGGTIVKAHGTGSEMTKFFGVSITEEKDMVYIVARRDEMEKIMRAIMDKAGMNTEAHGVVFSLPVEDVEGFSL